MDDVSASPPSSSASLPPSRPLSLPVTDAKRLRSLLKHCERLGTRISSSSRAGRAPKLPGATQLEQMNGNSRLIAVSARTWLTRPRNIRCSVRRLRSTMLVLPGHEITFPGRPGWR